MIPYFVLDQIAIGPITLHTWGLFVGLGFSAGYLWFYYSARKESLAPKKIAGLALAIFFGAMLGAWLLARLTAGGGAMFMGGLLGAIVAGVLYVLFVRLDLWCVADLLVLPALLGIGLGRVGCFLINDHQGAATALSWGILWPDGISRHPVAIYESLLGFGLLAVLWFLRKKIIKPGRLFLIFLAGFSLVRFLLDFTRATAGQLADPRWGILSVSQWAALVTFTAALLILWHRRTKALYS